MIDGVLNGYYRTGTSIVWWILQQSNPDVPILYEPHSCGLHNEFRVLKPTADTINPLHGMPIYSPYFMVPDGVRERFLREARPKPVYTRNDFEDAVRTVEMFDELDRRVVVQSNQLHPVLEEFTEHFHKCRYVHIVRDPAEVLYSHAGSPSKLKRKTQQILITHATNYMISKWVNHGQNGKFEICYCMETAKKLGWVKPGDLLTKFLSAYINYNYHVLENLSNRGLIVRFENLVRSPSWLEKVASHLDLTFDQKYNKLDPRKAFPAPEKLKRAIKRRLDAELRMKLEELGYLY